MHCFLSRFPARLLLVSVLGTPLSLRAQPAPADPPPTAREVAAERKFLEGIPSTPTPPPPPPLPPGLRARGAPASPVRTVTRSGRVLVSRGLVPRGPIQVLLTAEEAARADAAGRLVPSFPGSAPQSDNGNFRPSTPEPSPEPARLAAPPPPPPVTRKDIEQAVTRPASFEVNPDVAISFSSVQFDLDSATVTTDGLEILRGIARGLKARPGHRFLVEGHTCDIGLKAYNNNLSTVRATAVCAWLRHYGVPSAQIQPFGCGEAHPLFKPDPALSEKAQESLRAPSRRVEFRELTAVPLP